MPPKGNYKKRRPSGLELNGKQQKKLKYGNAGKKDREFMQEHGQMHSAVLDVESLSDELDITDDTSKVSKKASIRRIIDEKDLDRENYWKRNSGAAEDQSENSDVDVEDVGDEWNKPSAYETLVKSIKSTKKKNPILSISSVDDELIDQEDAELSVDSGNSADESGDEVEIEFVNDLVENLDAYELHFHTLEKETAKLKTAIDIVKENSYSSQKVDSDLGICVIQSVSENITLSASKTNLEDFSIKQRLHEPWITLQPVSLSPKQALILKQMSEYRDILMTSTTADPEVIMKTYALHAMNHVLKTRSKIIKNSDRIKKHTESAEPSIEADIEIRDQGYTRPKVLVLLPFKHTALKFIQSILTLCNSDQQDNKKRFNSEFVLPASEMTMDPKKPADYQQTFLGNIDDCFRIGIKVNRKSVKLYSEFYASDILIASPLGLRTIIGSKGDTKRDYDFLSSIEVVIVDHAHTLQMQNWDHVQHIFQHLNLQPTAAHGCDFSRVMNWYLDGHAKYMRQTLVFGAYATPDLNSLYSAHCQSVAGRIKIRERSYDGAITNVIPHMQQVYTRVDTSSLNAADDERFTHFTTKTLPSLTAGSLSKSHTLLFIPSFFDFTRLKNHFTASELSFAVLSEYTSLKDVSRARSDFLMGRVDFLLMTERFHYFRRFRIKGINKVVFYSVPQNAHFYAEIINMTVTEDQEQQASDVGGAGVQVLYNKFDALALEKVVGSKRVGRMIASDKTRFMFA